ncbi:MAG: LacI family DNA-binding transcriptional regulator [Anaerolineae bacterium]|nr:LacI family DNA-binding transcriptional regulator [Anaerolineae bacterium]
MTPVRECSPAPERVSIKDIAHAVGVSHSTVSRALNDSPLINEKTRARIQAVATEMGYIPNAVARGLKAQRSSTVGLVVTSLTDPFFSEVMAGVDAVAGAADLSMFVTASHNDPEREMAVIETFHRRRVDGIIVAASRLSNRYRNRLARIQVPIVLLNQHTDETQPDFHSVAFDEREGARLAVEHLLDLGHRRIGYLGLGNRQRSNRLRHEGYERALRDAGIVPAPDWAHVVPEHEIGTLDDAAVGERAFPALLDSGVTAALCYNDRTAAGALVACRQQRVQVPVGISIVGFDDIELARWISPPLTTVRQPREAMGRVAMEMMLALLAGDAVEDRVLMPELVRRESTGKRDRG